MLNTEEAIIQKLESDCFMKILNEYCAIATNSDIKDKNIKFIKVWDLVSKVRDEYIDALRSLK